MADDDDVEQTIIDALEAGSAEGDPHELDIAKASMAMMGIVAETVCIARQVVEKRLVEVAVDQPGPRPLKLVAHSPGTPYLDIEVVREALHRFFEGRAEGVATRPRRRRVLNDVNRQWNDPCRPSGRSAKHQRERNCQAMIDIHLVGDGDVELIEDQRLGDVPAKIGSAFHNRDRTRAPAFIRRLELLSAS